MSEHLSDKRIQEIETARRFYGDSPMGKMLGDLLEERAWLRQTVTLDLYDMEPDLRAAEARNEKLEQVMGEMQTILEKHVCYDGDPDHCFACRCLLRLRTKNDGDSLQGVEQ